MSPLRPWILTLGLLTASSVAGQPGAPDKIRRGTVLLDAGDLQGAEALFREALEAQPRRVYRVWHLLGQVELLRRDGDKAKESFDRALLLAPRFGPALLGRGQAALLLGELDSALEALGTAAELPATADEASLLKAQLLIYLGRLDEARRLLEEFSVDDERTAARMLLQAISPSEQAERNLKVG